LKGTNLDAGLTPAPHSETMGNKDDSWEHRVERVLKLSLDVQKAQLEWFKSQSSGVTKNDLDTLEKNIMSAFSDFAAKQKTFNDRQSAAIESIATSVTGLTGDVKSLNDKITELQNSPGTITPEDQALLDDLQAQGEAAATKAEGVAAAVKALDDQTPPVVPANP